MSATVIQLSEWESIGPGDPGGAGLRGLCLNDGRSRAFASELSRQHLLDVTELRHGLSIRTTSWVGRVRLGDLEVVVEPKIAPGLLLDLLRYAYGLRDLRLFEHAEYVEGSGLLIDLLLLQLHAEAKEILERGLHRRYRSESAWLASPRGRIVLTELVSPGSLTEARLPCRYSSRSADNALNQALQGGLFLGARMTSSTSLSISLSHFAGFMAHIIEPVPLTRDLLDRAWRSLNRLNRVYEPALKLVTILLSGSVLSIEGHGGMELPGFLFDMNRFFQALLARFLDEYLERWTVHEERGIADLMRYLPERNPRLREAPSPRPDFTLIRPGSDPILLDAKYRDLWELPLPREMLYQLAIYALSQRRGATATILYPTIRSNAKEAAIRISDPIAGGARAFVSLQPVLLPEIHSIINDSSRHRLARGRQFVERLCARAALHRRG